MSTTSTTIEARLPLDRDRQDAHGDEAGEDQPDPEVLEHREQVEHDRDRRDAGEAEGVRVVGQPVVPSGVDGSFGETVGRADQMADEIAPQQQVDDLQLRPPPGDDDRQRADEEQPLHGVEGVGEEVAGDHHRDQAADRHQQQAHQVDRRHLEPVQDEARQQVDDPDDEEDVGRRQATGQLLDAAVHRRQREGPHHAGDPGPSGAEREREGEVRRQHDRCQGVDEALGRQPGEDGCEHDGNDRDRHATLSS